jgi:anion-transporting  ArsA/GET3 family ATPase
MMMLPTRRGLRMLNIATQPILRSIGRVVGGDVLTDAIAFFQAFDGMETGFRQRADEVLTLLRSDVTHYVLVASPRGDTVDEAAYFANRLQAAGLGVDALIVNRSTPTFGELPERRPRAAAAAALYDNLAELHATSDREHRDLEGLLDELHLDAEAGTIWVPLLAGDVHDLDGLATIRALLFD